MSRLALVLVLLASTLGGCTAHGGDYRYDSYPRYRVYYDDDRNYHRWHRDRYEERRHSHYAPGYDGRYQWHDDRRRYRDHRYQAPRHGWDQRYRDHDRRGHSHWQGQGWQRHDGYSRDRDRRYDRGHVREHDGRRNRHSQRGESVRGWRLSN
ncbi:MAG TPA: hypothetical protein VLF16_13655 [Pseudomonas sp.]|nr:hypothetical protein [Pseudomonas sp.]